MHSLISAIKRITEREVASNAGWMLFAQIYQMALSLAVGVLCARYLGPENYGLINYAASFVSFFSVVCALGLEGIAVKEFVSEGNDGAIIGTSILLRFVSGFLSMLAICVIVYFLDPDNSRLLVIAFLESIALLFNAVFIIENWYQSRFCSRAPSLVRCFAYTIMSAYRVCLLVLGQSVEWFAFATSLDALIIAILYLMLYKKDRGQKLSIDQAMGLCLIRQSYHLTISSIMAVIYSQMDRVMLGKMAGMTQVGLYTSAAAIYNIWMVVPKSISDAARPQIMKLHLEQSELYGLRLRQVIAVLFWASAFFALIVTFASEMIVGLLFGAEYHEAASPLVFLIWSTVFAGLSYPRTIWMICENKQKYAKRILLWGVVINIVLNIILIPRCGVDGAAFATLVTEVSCCCLVPFFYKDVRPFLKEMFCAFFLRGVFLRCL